MPKEVKKIQVTRLQKCLYQSKQTTGVVVFCDESNRTARSGRDWTNTSAPDAAPFPLRTALNGYDAAAQRDENADD